MANWGDGSKWGDGLKWGDLSTDADCGTQSVSPVYTAEALPVLVQPCPPSTALTVSGTAAHVSNGGSFSVALKSDGTVWVWGSSFGGEFGRGLSSEISFTPVQVHGAGNVGFLTGVIAIACGEVHALAVKSDGTVWAWGNNQNGQLGDGTLTNRTSPVQVVGVGNVGLLSGVIAIACGRFHVVALKSDGTMVAWGQASQGQLGQNTNPPSTGFPVQVHGEGNVGFLTSVISIGARGEGSMAITSDGTLWSWGVGLVGDNTSIFKMTPVKVHGAGGIGFFTGAASVVGNSQSNYIPKSDGTLWAWGDNENGQIGDGTITGRLVPVQVHGVGDVGLLSGVVAVFGSYKTAFAIVSAGTLLAWGGNSQGQLGDGTLTNRLVPVQVHGVGDVGFLSGVVSVSINAVSVSVPPSVIAITSDGAVWAWGDNASGQLGDNTTLDRLTPTQVHGVGNVGFFSII